MNTFVSEVQLLSELRYDNSNILSVLYLTLLYSSLTYDQILMPKLAASFIIYVVLSHLTRSSVCIFVV